MQLPQKADLMPWLARLISSPVLRRIRNESHRVRARLTGQSDLIRVFINPRDPFALPLLQALQEMSGRFCIRYRFHTVREQPDDMFPEPGMWADWARKDATRIARLYGLTAPNRADAPSEDEMSATEQLLLEQEDGEHYLACAIHAMTRLWATGEAPEPAPARLPQALAGRLQDNEHLRQHLGHYQGCMVYFRGDWFWGVDRLDHLERILLREGRARGNHEPLLYNRTWAELGRHARQLPDGHPARDQVIEVFFSIRSPYSYLGLERAVLLARAWKLQIKLRPVLPMLMRGQPVPDIKKWYIFQDTRREALKLGLPYGFVADPLGPGVERCYALFEYARSRGRELEYMLEYARAVNAEGIRSETDAGLERIVTGAGLDWQTARTLLTDTSWKVWAEANRQAMYELGLWGVPSFRYGSVTCWGQDRLWLIEEEIRARAGSSPDGSATSRNQ